MLFSSIIYIFIFLPFTFFVYFHLHKKRNNTAARVFLVLASMFFYGWWNPIYLPIIISSMVFNYYLGEFVSSNKPKHRRKLMLTFGISVNLLALAYFKYMDFFIQNLNFISNSSINLLHLALPLAISFFTFQQIAFLVDSYKSKVKEYDFLTYALFVSFFPQLIAGPIVHHKEMMPQFASTSNYIKRYRNISLGIFIFCIGLFKKIVIADSFSPIVSHGFDHSSTLTFFESWFTSLSYTMQIYFDFSGYTDMAIGSALIFNIKLPINFNSPYKATNIQEFWQRWHITLSRFLRDYIYIPLGGNRKGNIKTYSNLFLTFLIGGIWHGAGWTFFVWGILHGFATVIHKAWAVLGFKLNKYIAWFITFNFINITWVFFRAHSWEDAFKVLKGMIGLNGITLPTNLQEKLSFLSVYGIDFGRFVSNINSSSYLPLYLLLSIIFVATLPNSNEISKRFAPNLFFMLWMLIIAFTSFIFAMYLNVTSEFIYFQF